MDAATLRRIRTTALALAVGLPVLAASAQQRDPRIGEWREDRDSPNAVGLYLIFEELENGMMRAHIAENLARQNRLHEDYRCDGDFYPRVNAEDAPTGTSTSCRIVDANTVVSRLRREADDGWVEGEGTSAVSPDGSRLTTTFERRDRAGNVVEAVERRFTRNVENCLNHERDEQFRECQQRTSPPRQPRDPRIGEWRQDRDSPTPQGLYRIFEDMGGGMTRIHVAANLATSCAASSSTRAARARSTPSKPSRAIPSTA